MLNLLNYFYAFASFALLYLGDQRFATALDHQQVSFTNKLYEAAGKDYALDALRSGDSEYLLWHLENPIRFYSDIYNHVYINTNGILTFNNEFPDYINQPFPLEYPAVAPFYANVDTTNSSTSNTSTTSITIFTSQNPDQLQYVSELVHYAFDNRSEFEASELVVATWKNVGYFDRRTDKLNTFQVALILGDAESYVQFIYPTGGLNWLQGENGPLGLPDIRAQAGFISEDGRFFNLIGSGANSVRFLSENSNVNIPGIWLYRVGVIESYEDNIEEPTRFPKVSDASLNWKTCRNVGYRTCHQNAKCIDRLEGGGFCCNCQAGFYGNGEICIKNDIPIRVIGSLMGELNGIFINERSKLQSYIVTADGRTYTAITPIDKELGAHLRLALPIITAIGWLFAKPLRNHLNGYQLTGGELLHSTKLSFDSGEILWINQTFEGLNYWDQLAMKVDLFGRVPHIPHNLKLHMAEFIEEYEFVLANELHAQQTHFIEIPEENRVVSFKMEQRIYFDPCMEVAEKELLEGSKYLHKISKIMLDYFEKDEALRSSVLTTVGVNPTSNPCTDGTADCGANMVCIPYEDTYRCDCMYGYTTEVTTADVEICVDIDECALGTHACDDNSVCVNAEGGFSCHCADGFEGNGYRCFVQNTVADSIVKYSTFATTTIDDDDDDVEEHSLGVEVTPDSNHNRQLQDNFTAVFENHGSYYDRIDNCHRCSLYATCWEGHCVCRSGYSGDGIQCYANCADDEMWEVSVGRCVKFGYDDAVTVEAQCDYWGQCTCEEGYELSENGAMCRLLVVDNTITDEHKFDDFIPCDVEFNCHANATCDWYEADLHYRCTCKQGYHGNGYQCEPHEIVESCSTKPEICHKYAFCAVNELFGTSECQCQNGYNGDGYHCDISPVCMQNDDCEVNAFCDGGVCHCNSGFERNSEGICVMADSCGSIQQCGTNAVCKYDRISDAKYCRCLEDYEGNALTICHPIKRLMPCNVQFNCDAHATCEPTEDPAVYECQCGAGYNGDGYICIEDQNCLNSPQLCDMNAQCLSTNNGLVCVCNKGFYGNGSVCLERRQHESGFLIVSQGVVIVRVPLNGKNVRPISVASMAIGLDKDCIEGRIYWGDISTKKIISSKYDGSDMKTFISDDIESPEGIAIDSISRRIYWTDSVKDTIEVASLEQPSLRTILINKNLVNPRGIAVDPYREKLYWSDWNRESPKIEMSDLDGTGREVLLSKGSVILPNSLVVLERTGELCYADAGAKKVECVDAYNKHSRIISNDLTYPFGLVYTNEQFFWTDWITKKLENVDTFGQRQQSLQIPLFGSHKMYAMTAIEDVCPQVESACQRNNGGCADARLCLVNRKAPSGKSCKCTLQSKLCAAPNSIV